MDRRADTPWYPAIRLFRQPRPGDWDGAVRLVIDAAGRAGSALEF